MIVITTEPDPATSSKFHGRELRVVSDHSWQDFVRSYVESRGREPIKLSQAPTPTSDDVPRVVEYARRHYPSSWPRPDHVRQVKRWTWQVTRAGPVVTGEMRMAFFTSDAWAHNVPSSRRRLIVAADATANGDPSAERIRLVTVAGFKGLEAPAVIL